MRSPATANSATRGRQRAGTATAPPTAHLGPRCGDGTHQRRGVRRRREQRHHQRLCTPTASGMRRRRRPPAASNATTAPPTTPAATASARADCTLGPRCGDGIKNGHRSMRRRQERRHLRHLCPGCTLAPRCGDGTLQRPPARRATTARSNETRPTGRVSCTDTLQARPPTVATIGRRRFGEVATTASTAGSRARARPTARAAVPLPVLRRRRNATGEQCDDGPAKTAPPSSACDAHCQ